MKVYGVIGWKNAGKTSLMERLVAEITGRTHVVQYSGDKVLMFSGKGLQ